MNIKIKYLLVLFVLVPNCLHTASGAKILCVAFTCSRSHKITYDPLLEALAARGHEVTVVTPVPSTKIIKNLREIQVGDGDGMSAMIPNMFEVKSKGGNISPFNVLMAAVRQCNAALDSTEVKALRSMTFDLIFVPANVNECSLAFAWTFKTNVILISPLSVITAVSSMLGTPSPSSFVPHAMTGYTNHMNFYERIVNFVVEIFIRGFMHCIMFSEIEKVYKEKLGHDVPSPSDLYKNTSMIFSNSHFSIGSIRPFLPDIVEVGGMHCRPAKALPKELEDFVSSSGEDGFILFSMGSLLKGSTMPEEKRKILNRAFSKLKQKVLWKWETEEMDDLPPNVKLSKWVPQQDVLGHPKIRAFITHGGFGSTAEAAYHGVPIIGFPMFADQTINMELAKQAGYGLVLDFNTISEEKLLEAINSILTDSRYKERALAVSKTFQDQPNHPLDRAVFWSEYVIRHKGAHHLRSAARDLNFFQYYSLDVIGFLSATLVVIICILYKALLLLFKAILQFISKAKPKIDMTRKKK